jgi:hypothetical protein
VSPYFPLPNSSLPTTTSPEILSSMPAAAALRDPRQRCCGCYRRRGRPPLRGEAGETTSPWASLMGDRAPEILLPLAGCLRASWLTTTLLRVPTPVLLLHRHAQPTSFSSAGAPHRRVGPSPALPSGSCSTRQRGPLLRRSSASATVWKLLSGTALPLHQRPKWRLLPGQRSCSHPPPR